TEQTRAETELRKSHERLRRITARARSLREEERRRLSRELHDQLGQALASLKFDLSWLGGRLGSTADGTDLAAKVETMIQLTDKTIGAVRRISSELRPEVLD